MTVYLWRVMSESPPHYQCSKWDPDFSDKLPKEVYYIFRNSCDCPAHVPFCKHLAQAKDCRDRGISLDGLVYDDQQPSKFFRFMGSRGQFYNG